MQEPSVKHLVVDAGAFIKNVPLKDLGEAIYTTREVVAEIRDAATRERLQVLPYELQFRSPSTEASKLALAFASKTGDLASLSAADLGLVALATTLQMEWCGGRAAINQLPQSVAAQVCLSRAPTQNPRNIVGFHASSSGNPTRALGSGSRPASACDAQPQLKNLHLNSKVIEAWRSPDANAAIDVPQSVAPEVEATPTPAAEEVVVQSPSDPGSNDQATEQEEEENNTGAAKEESDIHSSSEEEERSEEEGSSEEDWIGEQNVADARRRFDANAGPTPRQSLPSAPVVAVLTGDFAIQNVLMQMGVKVIGIDGMVIEHLRSYVLRCHACFKATSVMTRRFCANCGNATLDKVAVTVHNGEMRYHLSRRKLPSAKGLKYSLPAPRGGQHAANPQLCADQPMPQQRLSRKALQKVDPLSDDYTARASPFLTHDLASRASRLGVKSGGRKINSTNPNGLHASKKRGGKRR